MKNITNAYLVLSVANIKAMLAAAELEQKRKGDFNDRVALVLEDITINLEDSGGPQIASWSVNQSVADSVKHSQEDIDAKRSRFVGMNHSDAAV